MILGIILNVIFAMVAVYSTYKMVEDIKSTFYDGDRFIAGILLAALLLVWGVAISYYAFNHVFPWLDSL